VELETRRLWFKHAQEANQEGGFVNRYRRDWDEDGKADSRDSAAGKPGSAASIPADANWVCCAASRFIVFLKRVL
jgi:hypothetical protein